MRQNSQQSNNLSSSGRSGVGRFAKPAIIIAGWLVVWEIASICIGNKILIAGPVDTLAMLVSDVQQAKFWSSIWFSFARIAAGFLISLIAGIALGALAARVSIVRDILAPLMAFIKSTPVVCIIVLLLIWMGSANVSILAVALVTLPPIYYAILGGLSEADRKMIEMLDTFEISTPKRIRYYYIPLVAPYLTSALKVAIGMSWKSGIAAEVIGIPNGSIGSQIYFSKISLETANLFSWTLVIIALSVVCEKLFLKLFEFSKSRFTTSLNATVPQNQASSAEDADALLGEVTAIDSNPSCNDATAIDSSPSCNDATAIDSSPSCNDATAIDRNALLNNAAAAEIATQGINFKSVSFSYGERPDSGEISSFSHAFEKGSVTCMIGRSGIGKTTLLNIANGFEKPLEGVIKTPQVVSRDFQENRLLTQLSAWQNVQLVINPNRFDSAATAKLLLDELLGEDSATLAISEMSGGMKRKCALIRTLAAPGSVLLLDEPFSGLDPESKASSAKAISILRGGRTTIIATHDRTDAELLDANLLDLNECDSFAG